MISIDFAFLLELPSWFGSNPPSWSSLGFIKGVVDTNIKLGTILAYLITGFIV
jgi:hypothetical protein